VGVALLIHITAGGLGIVSGYAALYAAKGAGLHRRSGLVFVCSMVTMAVFAAGMAAARGEPGNVTGGLLTAYLVITALTTVRPRTAGSRRLDLGAMLVALAIGAANVALGLDSLLRGDGTRNGVPAALFLVFGAIALASGLSDLRLMRGGEIRGARRLSRHLWRMCFALFIATGSFFLGQADELPEPLRVFPLLAIPAFLPLLLMPYWLWRVRPKRISRAVVAVCAPEAA
jgi:hypothetical protein